MSNPSSSIIRRHQRAAPVTVVGIATDLGLKVWSQDLGNGVAGKLSRANLTQVGASGWAIYVNRRDAEVRRRFTVAHEIGHFLLHVPNLDVGEEIQDDTFYRSALSSSQERQANEFAADLLMPFHLINSLTESGITEPDELARRLKVSETAMRIRLGLPT